MRVKALVSFTGALTMSCGEIREYSNDAVLADLLDAGYIARADPETEDDAARKRPKSTKKKQVSV